MSSVAAVFSAASEHGAALCRGLKERGWTVVGGSESVSPGAFNAVPMDPRSTESLRMAAESVARDAGTVDLLVYNITVSPDNGSSVETGFNAALQAYDTIALGAIRFVEAFLPLMENGQKRLCFVTDACGSITETDSSGDIDDGMATTALHMACKNLFNDLRSNGFIFRLFLPELADPESSAEAGISFFTSDRDDENRLVIIDFRGREWPF
jgi:NAD(P)-dependent dehydrogenase (short-subunit alcohol dehydrogenase family)